MAHLHDLDSQVPSLYHLPCRWNRCTLWYKNTQNVGEQNLTLAAAAFTHLLWSFTTSGRQGQTIKYTAAWAPQPEWMRAPPIVMPASRTLPIHVQGGLECHEPPTCFPCAVAEVDGDTPPPCSPGQDAFQRAGSGEKAFCLVWPGLLKVSP